MFKGRSTTDVLILMIAGTICFAVLASGATVAALEVVTKGDADTTVAFKSIQDVINTLIGLLAGFLAGRTESARQAQQEKNQWEKGQQERRGDAPMDHE